MAENVRPAKTVFGSSFGRPVTINLPNAFKSTKSYPLAIGLHAFGAAATDQPGRYRWNASGGGFQIEDYDDGTLTLYPTGTTDLGGHTFWNASAACCNFFGSTVDDQFYIYSLIQEVMASYNVDRRFVVCAGYSNGGFMALRMAANCSDLVTHAIAYAGCNPTVTGAGLHRIKNVSALQIHGTADGTVVYAGDPTNVISSDVPRDAYPGGMDSANQWGVYNGGGVIGASYDTYDFDASFAGQETVRYACPSTPADGAAEHWAVTGQGHVPNWQGRSGQLVWAWVKARPRVT